VGCDVLFPILAILSYDTRVSPVPTRRRASRERASHHAT